MRRQFACIASSALLVVAILVGAEAWVSSRDEIQVRLPGLEMTLPSVSPQPGATKAKSPTGTRTRICRAVGLAVPRINVDTQVLALGTNSIGGQSLPDNPYQVSWWNGGSIPGQPGNAVFAGHTWSQGNGVFDRLSELADGNIVVVHGKGCVLTFVVDTVQPHVPANLPSSQVESLYATTGPSGIVLITCGDYSNGVYHSRVVVHARLVK